VPRRRLPFLPRPGPVSQQPRLPSGSDQRAANRKPSPPTPGRLPARWSQTSRSRLAWRNARPASFLTPTRCARRWAWS